MKCRKRNFERVGKPIYFLQHWCTVDSIVSGSEALKLEDVNEKLISRLGRERTVFAIILSDETIKRDEGKDKALLVSGER